MRRHMGFTLIEVVATLTIMALIAAAGIRGVIQYHRDGQFRQLEANAARVMHALNGFYEANCSSGGPTPNIANLISGGYLNQPGDAYNPFGPDISVSIQWGTPTTLSVWATIQGRSATGVAANIGATRVSGNRVYWDGLPKVLTSDDSYYTMQLKHMYEPGACT